MRNKNLWIILAAVALIAAVFAAGMLMKPAPGTISNQQIVTITQSSDAPDAEPEAYLLVTVGGVTYQPLPLSGEGEFSLTQGESGMVNTVHVTPDSVWMADSTCDNQDCVEQGTVSLATMNDRVLGNMIICLPHQVTLELYTAEEMNALIASLEEAQ
ncbi:MAG: NusG domain II-containing protein [Clostridia bacterium]|nr:NusG domain II-containing protein [Clostridia bacterium]